LGVSVWLNTLWLEECDAADLLFYGFSLQVLGCVAFEQLPLLIAISLSQSDTVAVAGRELHTIWDLMIASMQQQHVVLLLVARTNESEWRKHGAMPTHYLVVCGVHSLDTASFNTSCLGYWLRGEARSSLQHHVATIGAFWCHAEIDR
jgi:hypothetical protein